MEKMPASIFNDVFGPVMRGPSSSHVAGAERIASLIRQSLSAEPVKVVCDFDPTGALAASHTGHGSDMGFTCGLLGIDLKQPNVDQYKQLAKDNGLEIEYRILEYGAKHPGNYRVHAEDRNGASHDWEAISVGGGMVEMQIFDGFKVSIAGDFYELLVVVDLSAKTADEWKSALESMLPAAEYCLSDEHDGKILFDFKFADVVPENLASRVKATFGIVNVVSLKPILPIRSRAGIVEPFSTCAELFDFASKNPMEAWEYASLYEEKRGNVGRTEVCDKMNDLLTIMENAVETGLAGTNYANRILGPQAHMIDEKPKRGRLAPLIPLNAVIRDITAVMETKSSMGLIIAAPTVGSCGCIPGTVIGLGCSLELERDELVKALLVAGLVGVFFAEQATFSAEVGGCQVECGAASGMAAAAVASMMGGDIFTCMNAASTALQNITGLACDPVGNRVEVPCLGKNVMGGSNAISSANMAIAGYNPVIPLDETIKAIMEIGLSLPLELRCTCGGLGKTPTSFRILEELKAKK